jgi:hypothetical protein
MSKICPFCKKEVSPNDAVCSHCTRVLREKISINKTSYTQPTRQDTASDKRHKSKNDFTSFLKLQTKKLKNLFSSNKTYVVGHNNRDKHKLFILIVIALLFFIGLYVKNNKPIPPPISVIPDNQSELNNIPKISQKDPKDYISLQNGTVFSKKSYYLNGLGELQIKNGTNLDAIAKLVNMTINKSIFTVYIKANSTYTIKNVKDGNYKLFFNLGNDWNSQIKAFNVNSGYEVFEDLFDFTTREYEEGDYIRTRYSKFEVTLNPVIGGNAETKNVNAVEFANY